MGFLDGMMGGRKRKSLLKAIDELRRVRVSEIMSKYMVSVRPEDTIVMAATKMIAEDVSCLIAFEGDQMKGILSERDFLLKVPLNKKALTMRVSEIMTPNVVTVEPDTPLVDCVTLMKEKGFRRMVIAKGGKPIGLVTQTDFSKRLAKTFQSYPLHSDFIVEKIMRDAVVVTPKDDFITAREKMRKEKVGAVIIADKMSSPQILQGIFSEYDVVMQFFDQRGSLDIKELDAFMRKYVRGIVSSSNIFEANHLLLKKQIHRLPVMRGEKLVGLLTQTFLIRFIYTSLDHIESIVQEEDNEIQTLDKNIFSGRFSSDHFCVYLDKKPF